ncbi:MAG: YlbL family protein [Acidimicrobiales bacterium]
MVLALIGSIVSASVVKLDYYAFRPGSVRDTSGLIEVAGAETFPAEGTISYTTVSLRHVSLFQLVQGWIDPDIDIHSESEVLQGRDREENRQVNLQLMDTSQEFATQVALEALGYEVPVSITGQLVLDVQGGFPADGVLEAGDTIVAIDGERLDDPQDLERLLDDEGPGDEAVLTVLPFTETAEEEVAMTLAASPDDVEQGVMGVQVQPTGIEFDFPIDATFDTGEVGGPSAGLAFALALIDALTPGELTGGVSVAVTGTIEPDGAVGPIGGAGQKAAAAREAGVDVFLVPSADYESAVAHAGDVEVVRVDSLDEALAALAEFGGNGLDLPNLAEDSSADETD